MQPVSNSINGGSAAGSLRSAEEFCAAVALALAVFLGASLYKHAWLIDGQGLANATDFVSLWAAGLQTLDGHPAAAYDWTMHKQAEDVALAHATDSYISWAYPPIYLFVGAGLASLPYFAAFASYRLNVVSICADLAPDHRPSTRPYPCRRFSCDVV